MRRIDDSRPCYNCTKRSCGCHSTCKEYMEFNQANRARLDQISQKRSEDRMLYNVKVKAIKRVERGW